LFLLLRLSGEAAVALRLSRRTAAFVAVATGLATQMWPSASTLYADNSAAFLVALALWSLVRMRLRRASDAGFLLAAVAAAVACLCTNNLVLACPALAIYGLAELNARRRAGALPAGRLAGLIVLAALPFLAVAAVQLWYNHARYGSVWDSGYGRHPQVSALGFSTPLLVGLYGIFLSSGRSLFLYSPLCLLALAGARPFARRLPRETALVLGAAVPLVVFYAKWWAWHGGWEWGGRFYLFLIPLLMWVSAPAWRWMDRLDHPARRWRLWGLGALVAVSLFVQGLGVLVHPGWFWAMQASEVATLPHSRFEKGVWEIRDEAPLAHFVPEFSPVAGHAWLVWATLNRDRLSESRLAEGCPWRLLLRDWTPARVTPYLGFDLWFWTEWTRPRGWRVATVIFVVLLGASCVGCLKRLRTALENDAVLSRPSRLS
jgi:hypothetical protein